MIEKVSLKNLKEKVSWQKCQTDDFVNNKCSLLKINLKM